MSDSHGGYRAMMQCLERCGFDNDADQLYFLGDVVDGWPETKESIDVLLGINHLVYLLGNHDQWALEYYGDKMGKGEDPPGLWLWQGGAATIESYGAGKPMPKDHLALLQNAKPYHVTEDNILLVHAGFDTEKAIEETDPDYLIWDRTFVKRCYSRFVAGHPLTVAPYKEVYIGHTPTISLDRRNKKPLHIGNVTLTDTGAAFNGCLSILDMDSKEVWQSDIVMQLYPSEEGRNGMSWNQLNQK